MPMLRIKSRTADNDPVFIKEFAFDSDSRWPHIWAEVSMKEGVEIVRNYSTGPGGKGLFTWNAAGIKQVSGYVDFSLPMNRVKAKAKLRRIIQKSLDC